MILTEPASASCLNWLVTAISISAMSLTTLKPNCPPALYAVSDGQQQSLLNTGDNQLRSDFEQAFIHRSQQLKRAQPTTLCWPFAL